MTNVTRRHVLATGAAATALWAMPSVAADGPVADTKSGKVRGVANGKALMFRGIPYGASTTGVNRFKPPVAPNPWTDIRDASDYGLRSPQNFMAAMPEEQVSTDAGPMSEDCLRLNVWTAGLADNGMRPVMVWFHGGGFAVGSGSNHRYDGSNLATKHGVVLVTINHRLGPMGFLDLSSVGGASYGESGNVGMLDCVAALQWVHDNIASFGGNPGNVTIFGESGGGAKVCTLMAMPAAKGLFHRAIVESGMSLKAGTKEDSAKVAQAVLGNLKIADGKLDPLQTLPVDQILAAAKGPFRFGPVVDGSVLPSNPFDPAAPSISADVPMIIGTNETEATFFPTTPLDPLDDAAVVSHVKDALKISADQAARIVATYRKGWPGKDNTWLLQILLSDNWMGLDSSIGAERKAALGKAQAYLYHFEKTTPVRDGKLHTPHTLEIPYVFDNVDLAKEVTGDGPERQALADTMSGAWTRFARTGDPNGGTLPHWAPYSAASRAVMIFNDTSKAMVAPHEAERQALLAARAAHA